MHALCSDTLVCEQRLEQAGKLISMIEQLISFCFSVLRAQFVQSSAQTPALSCFTQVNSSKSVAVAVLVAVAVARRSSSSTLLLFSIVLSDISSSSHLCSFDRQSIAFVYATVQLRRRRVLCMYLVFGRQSLHHYHPARQSNVCCFVFVIHFDVHGAIWCYSYSKHVVSVCMHASTVIKILPRSSLCCCRCTPTRTKQLEVSCAD
jgi:hypothetical protein